MKLENKVVLVTGAGSGMGRELAIQLANKKAKVAAIDFRVETLLETKNLVEKNNGVIETFVVDVSKREDIFKLPTQIKESLGSVDVLINNAGIIQPFVKINELKIEDAEKVMKVNFEGPFFLVKAFLPTLLQQEQAHILNVSSMGAYAPVPGQSVYGASKAALKLFTEGLRSELVGTKIGVTIAFPGAIDTNIATNSGMEQMTSDDPDRKQYKTTSAATAAREMIEAIEKNRPRIVIGRDAKSMDLLSRLNPVFAAKLIYKQMADLLK
jgi:short-subunit dehydrogenase